MPTGKVLASVIRNTTVAASSNSLTDAERGGTLNAGMRNSVKQAQDDWRNLPLVRMTTASSPTQVTGALARAAAQLRPLGIAMLDAQVLLSHVLGCTRSELIA